LISGKGINIDHQVQWELNMAENKEMSHDEMYESTKDVLSEAMDNLQTEGDYNEPTPPTFEEAQQSQEEEKVEASAETIPEGQTRIPDVEVDTAESVLEEIKLSDDDNEFLGNLKPKAQERFKELVARASQAESRVADYEVGNQVFEQIADSTTNPEQLNWALDVFKNLNSGNYDAAKASLKQLDQFSDNIAQQLGLDSNNNEAATYNDFTDLSKAVEDLDMSEDWANKLATNRVTSNSTNQARFEFDKNNQTRAQQETWYNNEASKAYESIQSWEKDIVDNDPDYTLKKEIMMEVGSQIANSSIPPGNWLPALKDQYAILSRGVTAVSKNIPNASKGSGPLAPSGNSGTHGNSGFLDTAEVTPEFLQAHLDQMHS